MRLFLRRKRMLLLTVSLGTCFAATSCAEEAQLTLVRIAFSSFTLPINQALLGFFSLINNSVVSSVTGS